MSERVPLEVLAAWGLGGAAVTEFERGLFNKHWLAQSGDTRTVVRRYNELRTPEAIAWEHELLGFAKARGWPVAPPLPAKDGGLLVYDGGRLWAAARFLEGEPDLTPTSERWHARGRVLARLHLDLEGFPGAQREGFGTSLEVDTWLAQGDAGGFDETVAAFDEIEPELASLVRERWEQNLEEIQRLGYHEVPRFPIHGDFQDFNLLWTGDELTGLLDFDSSRRDLQISELASLLVPFMPLKPSAAAAVVAGYESVRPLCPVERALLAPLTRVKLVWWVTILLTGWRRNGREVPGGILRTMTIRFPALDEMIPLWSSVWGF